MRKRARRTRLKPGPLLGLALGANVVIATFYSPLFALSRVRVAGADPSDKARIRGLIEAGRGVPALRLQKRAIESRVQSLPAVDSASFSANIFGRGVLKVRYRRPVAQIEQRPDLALAADGVMFVPVRMPGNLPWVRMPASAAQPVAALASAWDAGPISRFAAQARGEWPQRKLEFFLDNRGALCLNMNPGAVVFGSLRNLDTKLQILRDVLDQDPDFFRKVKTLVLTSPKNPAVVRMNGEAAN